MRVLFATLPAVGHAVPLGSIAAELDNRGHQVAWVAHPSVRDHLRPRTAPLFESLDEPQRDAIAVPGMLGIRTWFAEYLPAQTARMLPAVRQAIAAHQPDLMVVDQNCLAGVIAARLAGVPWVSVHVTPAFLLRRFAAVPEAVAWMQARVAAIQQQHGVSPLPWPIRSPGVTLVSASAAFLGPDADLREGDLLVGALTEHRATGAEPPQGPRPRILVSLGTLAGDLGRRFLDEAAAGLSGLGTVIIQQWVPMLDWLPHLDVVVCHGGQGTVNEALLHGLPLVIAPIRDDQPVVASRVEQLGAGRVLSFERAGATDIRAAVEAVLHDPQYRHAAQRIGLVPGTQAAADAIEAAR